jgi:hypothetical protein
MSTLQAEVLKGTELERPNFFDAIDPDVRSTICLDPAIMPTDADFAGVRWRFRRSISASQALNLSLSFGNCARASYRAGSFGG